MPKESATVPVVPVANSATSARKTSVPARAGVIWELTDGGRLGDLDCPEDLVSDDSDEWPFLEAVWRADPKLVWIAWWTMSCGIGAPDLARPIRELRRRAAQRGVSRSTWKRLTGESIAAALLMFEILGTSVLEAHLRLESLLKRALPFEGLSAQWTRRFLWRPDADHFDFARSRVELTQTQGAYLAGVGLASIAAGNFHVFYMDEFPLVLRYWRDIVDGRRLPPWESLLARARAAQDRAAVAKGAKTRRWDSGLVEYELGGYRITALSDSFALWCEGLTMRHCIADYADRCIADGLRVFHLHGAQSSSGWTLALEPERSDKWCIHEIRGPNNGLPCPEARAIAADWARAYAGIFPPGKNGLTPVDDDPAVRCPVCGGTGCDEHLLAIIESNGCLVDGRLCDLWDVRSAEIQEVLQWALLNERPNHKWPSEVDGIYAALMAQRHHLVIEDYPADPDFEWVIDEEGFREAWCDIDADRLLLNYLEEWLGEQTTTISSSCEISLEPGLSSSGRRFHAADPEPALKRFAKEFCVWPTGRSRQRSRQGERVDGGRRSDFGQLD